MPASLPCTAAGGQPGSCEQFPLCQQACPTQQRAGSQVPVSSFPCASRLPLQAGWRADGPLPQDFFLTTPSARFLPQDSLFKTSPGQPGSDTTEARLLPQGFFHKTSLSRLLPQELQRADSSPCRLFFAVACKHVFSNLQRSNYYNGRPK